MSERAQDVRDADATVVLPTPGRRRFGFAPALDRQAAAADVTALGGLNPLVEAANPILAAVPQIRHALRHPDPTGLRSRLLEQLTVFEHAARAAGAKEDTVKAACYALCALLDDSASGTPWGREWGGGLLAELHGDPAGAEGFFVLLEKMLGAPAQRVEMLEFLYLCLALGFEGRYRTGEGGRQALAQIRTRLYEAVSRAREPASRDLSGRWRGASVPVRRIPGALTVWTAASIAALVLAGLYFAYSVSLGAASDPVARDLARLRPIAFADAARHATPTTDRSRALAQAIGLPQVEIREAGDGIEIVLEADELFASGSARLHAELEPVVLKVAQALDGVPGAVLVTGHTDDLPIRTARFPSNWDLSAERARSVVRLMASRIHDRARLRAEGLADSDPVAPNDSPSNRARNRRVTILLRSTS